MMELLMRQTGRLISTEQFMEHIWGYDSEAEINGQPPAGSGTVRRAEAARRSRMDTVEISEEGRAASARLQGQQTEAAAEAEETERYEAEDLSEYTDAELKQMYYLGEITRQEYEDETGETLE